MACYRITCIRHDELLETPHSARVSERPRTTVLSESIGKLRTTQCAAIAVRWRRLPYFKQASAHCTHCGTVKLTYLGCACFAHLHRGAPNCAKHVVRHARRHRAPS